MVEDLVIKTYQDQIKESLIKAKAIEIAGFNLIINELKNREIDTKEVEDYFEKIKNSVTKEDLNSLKLDVLNNIINNLDNEIRKKLISQVDMSDIIIRKSRLIASEMSVDKKISENDKFIRIGINLANQVNDYGIAKGIDLCIKNYTIQKLYQYSYEEKIKEKNQALGIEEVKEEKTNTIVVEETKKDKFLKEIFNTKIVDDERGFQDIKKSYMVNIDNITNNINNYQNLISKYYDLSTEEKKQEFYDLINRLNNVIKVVSKDESSSDILSYNKNNTDNEDENLTKMYNNLIIIEEKLIGFLKSIGY